MSDYKRKYLKYKAKLEKLQSGGLAAPIGSGMGNMMGNPLMAMSLLGNNDFWNDAGLNNLMHAQLISQILPGLVKSPNMFNSGDIGSQLILLNGLVGGGVRYELPESAFKQLILGLEVHPLINGKHADEHIHEHKGRLMQHKHVHEHKKTKHGEIGLVNDHAHGNDEIHELTMITPNGYGFLMHVLGNNFSGGGKNRKEVDFLSAMFMMNLLNPRNSQGNLLSNDLLQNMVLLNAFNTGFKGGGNGTQDFFNFDKMFSGFNGLPLMLALLGNQNSELVNVAAAMGVGNLWKNPQGSVETPEVETFFSSLMQLKMFDLLNVSNPNMLHLMMLGDNMNPFSNGQFNVMLNPLMKLGLIKSLTGSKGVLPFKFNTNLNDSLEPLMLMNMMNMRGGDKSLNNLNNLFETMELAEIAKNNKSTGVSPFVAKLLKMGKQHFNMFLVDNTITQMGNLRKNDDGLVQSVKELFTPGVMLAQTNIMNEQEYFNSALMSHMFGYQPFHRLVDDNLAGRFQLAKMLFG